MTFCQRLKQLRKLNNVTQTQLATAIGVTDRACQRYESGENEPTLSKIEAIADYFQIPVDCLLCRGLFAKEELITAHKSSIIKALDNFYNTDFFSKISSKTVHDYELLCILEHIIKDILFDDSNSELSIEIFPLLPFEDGKFLTEITDSLESIKLLGH